MKIVKISLVIVVIGIISFFVIKSLNGSSEKQIEPPKEKNSVPDIENEINNISRLNVNRFCKQEYNLVKYHIDQKYQSKLLGKNDYENKQSKERLSKDLFFTYTEKFINQAYYVFNNSEWKREDIAFIRNECTILRNSDFMEEGSQVDNKCARIQLVLSKYDEINNFIASCNRLSYSDYGLDSSFPVSNVREKISKAVAYRANNLNNIYVNNCSRLHIQLNQIPITLFNKHFNYLKNKFKLKTENNSKKEYKQFKTFIIYRTIFNTPLISELGLMEKSLYNVNQFNSKYNELKKILDDDYTTAYTKI